MVRNAKKSGLSELLKIVCIKLFLANVDGSSYIELLIIAAIAKQFFGAVACSNRVEHGLQLPLRSC